MTLNELENLISSGALMREPPSSAELAGLRASESVLLQARIVDDLIAAATTVLEALRSKGQ